MSRYSDARGGTPYAYAGNLLARKASPLTGLNATQALMGNPMSVAAPVTASLLAYAEDEANKDDNTDSDNSSSSREFLPVGSSGSDKIQTNSDDYSKAKQLIANATGGSSSSDGSVGDQSANLTQEQVNQALDTILGTTQPSQAYKQVVDQPFWKDKGFISGLLTLAVAAASGMRPIQGLQLALAAKHKGDARQFLQLNQDILNKQYDPMSVMSAIQSGDMSKLKKNSLDDRQKFELQMLQSQLTGQQSLARQEEAARYQAGLTRENQDRASANTFTNAMLKAEMSGKPMGLAGALVSTESGGNPNAVSSKGARGPIQIMPSTAKNPGYGMQPIDLNTATPAEQVQWGMEYLQKMGQANGFTLPQTIAAYNAGPQAVKDAVSKGGDNWLAQLPSETQKYVSTVLAKMQGNGQTAGMSLDARMKAINDTGIDPMTGKAATPTVQAKASQYTTGGKGNVADMKPADLSKIGARIYSANAKILDPLKTTAGNFAKTDVGLALLDKATRPGATDADKKAAMGIYSNLIPEFAKALQGGSGGTRDESLKEAENNGNFFQNQENQATVQLTGLPSRGWVERALAGKNANELSANEKLDAVDKSLANDPAFQNLSEGDKQKIRAMTTGSIRSDINADNKAPSQTSATDDAAAQAAGATGKTTKPDGVYTKSDGSKVVVKNGYVYPMK